MARIGSSINPSLGAIDTSGYQEAIKERSRAIRGLGKDIAKTISTYNANKIQASTLSSENEAILASEEGQRLFGNMLESEAVPDSVKKSYKKIIEGEGGLRDLSGLNTFLRTGINQANKARAIQLENINIEKEKNILAEANQFKADKAKVRSILGDAIDEARINAEGTDKPFTGINASILNQVRATSISDGITLDAINSVLGGVTAGQQEQAKLLETITGTGKTEAETKRIGVETEEIGAESERQDALNAANIKALEAKTNLTNEEAEKLKDAREFLEANGFSRESVSEGFKEANKKFGERYEEDVQNLQSSAINIGKITDLLQAIDADPKGMGFASGVTYIPDFAFGEQFTNFFKPKLADARDRIRGIAYKTLRETLGAQFTEREGQRLVDTYFNPQLNEEQNLKRLMDFRDEMLKIQEEREAFLDYFDNNNGSGIGYRPKVDYGINIVKNLIDRAEQENAQLGLNAYTRDIEYDSLTGKAVSMGKLREVKRTFTTVSEPEEQNLKVERLPDRP